MAHGTGSLIFQEHSDALTPKLSRTLTAFTAGVTMSRLIEDSMIRFKTFFVIDGSWPRLLWQYLVIWLAATILSIGSSWLMHK